VRRSGGAVCPTARGGGQQECGTDRPLNREQCLQMNSAHSHREEPQAPGQQPGREQRQPSHSSDCHSRCSQIGELRPETAAPAAGNG
jgi:hypothetical protein